MTIVRNHSLMVTSSHVYALHMARFNTAERFYIFFSHIRIIFIIYQIRVKPIKAIADLLLILVLPIQIEGKVKNLDKK